MPAILCPRPERSLRRAVCRPATPLTPPTPPASTDPAPVRSTTVNDTPPVVDDRAASGNSTPAVIGAVVAVVVLVLGVWGLTAMKGSPSSPTAAAPAAPATDAP